MNFPLLNNFRIGRQTSLKPSTFSWVAARESVSLRNASIDVNDQTTEQPACFPLGEVEADQSTLLREMEYFDRF